MSISEKPLRFLKPNESKANYPLFVFLPGMDGTGQLLKTQLPGLEKFFDVRCLSMPGDDLTNWSGLVEQTADLIQAERQLGLSRPVYICGESFGGCLALKLAAYSHDLFEGLPKNKLSKKDSRNHFFKNDNHSDRGRERVAVGNPFSPKIRSTNFYTSWLFSSTIMTNSRINLWVS